MQREPVTEPNIRTAAVPFSRSRPAQGQRSLPRHSFFEERLIVREKPLAETEWRMVQDFVSQMERKDLRLRFGHPFDFGDEATLRPVFDVKAGVGEISWLLDETAAIAGIAHRVRLSRSEAEIALVVRSDLKRNGIGAFLLREMVARSAQQGIKTLIGLVLPENRPMLRLAADIGFQPRGLCALTIELVLEVDRIAAATVNRSRRQSRYG